MDLAKDPKRLSNPVYLQNEGPLDLSCKAKKYEESMENISETEKIRKFMSKYFDAVEQEIPDRKKYEEGQYYTPLRKIPCEQFKLPRIPPRPSQDCSTTTGQSNNNAQFLPNPILFNDNHNRLRETFNPWGDNRNKPSDSFKPYYSNQYLQNPHLFYGNHNKHKNTFYPYYYGTGSLQNPEFSVDNYNMKSVTIDPYGNMYLQNPILINENNNKKTDKFRRFDNKHIENPILFNINYNKKRDSINPYSNEYFQNPILTSDNHNNIRRDDKNYFYNYGNHFLRNPILCNNRYNQNDTHKTRDASISYNHENSVLLNSNYIMNKNENLHKNLNNNYYGNKCLRNNILPRDNSNMKLDTVKRHGKGMDPNSSLINDSYNENVSNPTSFNDHDENTINYYGNAYLQNPVLFNGNLNNKIEPFSRPGNEYLQIPVSISDNNDKKNDIYKKKRDAMKYDNFANPHLFNQNHNVGVDILSPSGNEYLRNPIVFNDNPNNRNTYSHYGNDYLHLHNPIVCSDSHQKRGHRFSTHGKHNLQNPTIFANSSNKKITCNNENTRNPVLLNNIQNKVRDTFNAYHNDPQDPIVFNEYHTNKIHTFGRHNGCPENPILLGNNHNKESDISRGNDNRQNPELFNDYHNNRRDTFKPYSIEHLKSLILFNENCKKNRNTVKSCNLQNPSLCNQNKKEVYFTRYRNDYLDKPPILDVNTRDRFNANGSEYPPNSILINDNPSKNRDDLNTYGKEYLQNPTFNSSSSPIPYNTSSSGCWPYFPHKFYPQEVNGTLPLPSEISNTKLFTEPSIPNIKTSQSDTYDTINSSDHNIYEQKIESPFDEQFCCPLRNYYNGELQKNNQNFPDLEIKSEEISEESSEDIFSDDDEKNVGITATVETIEMPEDATLPLVQNKDLTEEDNSNNAYLVIFKKPYLANKVEDGETESYKEEIVAIDYDGNFVINKTVFNKNKITKIPVSNTVSCYLGAAKSELDFKESNIYPQVVGSFNGCQTICVDNCQQNGKLIYNGNVLVNKHDLTDRCISTQIDRLTLDEVKDEFHYQQQYRENFKNYIITN